MKPTSRLIAYVLSAVLLLHPSAVLAASRTSTFTAASPQETFQNPASSNHFANLLGHGPRSRGGGPSCPTCPGGLGGGHASSASCPTCPGGGGGGAPSAPCPSCPQGGRLSGCPTCPSGGGLAAHDCPTCGERGPSLKVAGCSKCGEPEGLLVHSGKYYTTKTDLVIPGVGLDFRMCRIYRSDITYDGPLGKGWEFCHNIRLTLDTGESFGPSTYAVMSWIGMGRSDNFVWDGEGGAWINPKGWFGTLSSTTSPTGYKFVEPDGLTWQFEEDGTGGWYRLKEKKDRNGNALTYTYDGSSRVITVTDTLSRAAAAFTYDGNGRIVTMTDYGNRQVVYGYDTNGYLTSVRTPTVDAEGTEDDYTSGKTVTYAYDASGRLTSITNPADSNPFLKNFFDSNGKLTKQQLGASGQDLTFTYNTTTRKTTVVDREGNNTIYRYDTSDRVTAVELHGTTIGSDPLEGGSGGSTSGVSYLFAYENANHLITKVTYPKGNRFEYAFNSKGSVTTSTHKKDAMDTGLVSSFTHTSDFNQLSTSTDPEGRVFDFDHDSSGNLTKSTYPGVTNPSGIATTDKNGNSINDGTISTTFTRTSSGLPKTMIDPRGTTTSYSFSLVNSVTAYLTKVAIDSAGLDLTRSFAHDQFGNVTTATDGEGKTRTYVVNELNQVLKVTAPSPLSYVTKYHYDANDNLTKTEVENDTEVGNLWFVTDYQYDILNDLTKTIQDVDSSSNRITTTYAYDDSERLTKTTKPEANEVTFVYDERDLLVTRTRKAASSADDSSEIFAYDGNGNLTSQKDGKGNTTTFALDLYDRRTTTTFALSHYDVFAYDKNSNLTKHSRYNSGNTRLAETTSFFDEVNRLWKTEELAKKSDGNDIGADGKRTTTFWRDEMGAVLETTDEGSHVRANVYDKAGRLVTAKDALSGSEQNKVLFVYDKRSLLLTRSSDERSQDTGIESNKVIDTIFAYDNLGRLTKETNENGDYQTTTWNKRSLRTQVVDENSKKNLRRYDELGRVVTQIDVIVDNGSTFTDDVVTEFILDKNSRLVTLRAWNATTGNQDTTHTYDKLDRVVTTKYPDTFEHRYTYDKGDNVVTVVDPVGSTIVNTYDAQNRLTQVDITRATGVEGATKETFAYDGANRVTNAYSEVKPSQTIEFKAEVKFVYNTLSLVEKETLVIDGYASGNGRDTSYTYDEEGRLVTLTYPDSTTVTYHHDANDRIDTISRGATTVCDYAFAGPGRTIKKDKPGSVSEYKYDALGRVATIHHKQDGSGDNLFKTIYTYDKTINPESADIYYYDNNNVRITGNGDDQGQQYYYHNAYRLTKCYDDVPTADIVTRPPSNYGLYYEYVYDETGNRVTKKITGTTDTTYQHDKTNALTKYVRGTATTLGYDKNGSVVDHGSGSRQFSWYDYQNRRARINVQGDYPETKSRYDAFGRRVQKETSDEGTSWTKTRYYYSGWQVLHEADWSGTTESLQKRWVYGPWIDEPLEYVNTGGGGTYYYHEDSLGAVRLMADGSGVIQESYRYSEWGETSTYSSTFTKITGDQHNSPIGNRYAFTGRRLEEDAAEGAYYYRSRHYEDSYGRFLQRDPLAVDDPLWGENQYEGFRNRPASYVDPMGTDVIGPHPGGGYLCPPPPFKECAKCVWRCMRDNGVSLWTVLVCGAACVLCGAGVGCAGCIACLGAAYALFSYCFARCCTPKCHRLPWIPPYPYAGSP